MKLFATILALVLIGCPNTETIPRPKPQLPTDTDDCAAACSRLHDLRCPEGEPIPPSAEHPSGATCETFCRETQHNGHSLKPSCVKKIQACSQMETIQHSDTCPI